MRLIRINGKGWLVGLSWYVPHLNASIEEIKKYIEDNNGDCIVRRGIQVGFGQGGSNAHLVGKRSLAAWISIPEGNFIGIFPLVDDLTDEILYWMFARVNGNNMSGFGDTVFSTLQDALAAKDELKDLLPPETEINEETVFESVRESLAWLSPRCEVPFRARLTGEGIARPLGSYRSEKGILLKKMVLLSAASVLLGLGVYYGYDLLTDLGMTAKARDKAREIAIKRAEYERHPERLFPAAWKTSPRAAFAAASCLEEYSRIPINLGGWEFSGAVCFASINKPYIQSVYNHTDMASYMDIPQDAQFGGGKRGGIFCLSP